MNEEKGIVEENLNICNNYFLMKIKTETIAKSSEPGNFVMVGISSSYDPLLKRPFGIFNSNDNHIFLYYEVVGKGSKLLSEKKKGDIVDLIGPLGNSFPEFKDKKILLIAGGRGIAPIYYGIEKYLKDNEVRLVYGARSKNDLNLISNLKKLNLKDLYLYTDDGSSGSKGFVTTDLKDIISYNNIDITISCGPEKMFESLNSILKNEKTKDYVSMEAIMGCGIGICHSCVIETKNNGYKKVCSDGPIFDMGEIKW